VKQTCRTTRPRLMRASSRAEGLLVVMMRTRPSCEATPSMALRRPEREMPLGWPDGGGACRTGGLCRAFGRAGQRSYSRVFHCPSPSRCPKRRPSACRPSWPSCFCLLRSFSRLFPSCRPLPFSRSRHWPFHHSPPRVSRRYSLYSL
jgi:hypothetical protein